MSVQALSVGWQVIVNCISIGVRTVSSKFLQKRSLTELYVLKKKINERGPKVNELLRDMITRWMKDVGIEVHNNPAMVKYYKDDMLQHMNIEDVSLDSYSLSALEFVERSLRSKGYRTKENLNAAELIYDYRLNRAVARGKDLTLVKRLDPLKSAQPIELTLSRAELDYMYEITLATRYPSSASTTAPMPPILQMVVDEQPELQVKDSEPITLLDPLKVTYFFL